MTFGEKRKLFTKLICEHVLWLLAEGFEVTFDEGLDRLTEKDRTSDHMKNSLHGVGLAQDLNLFINGVWLTTTESHKRSGEKWESRHELCRWHP